MLVFTGTMDYRPNVEGVTWFGEEVWPELRRQVPGLKFTIVGRNPARSVQRLAEKPGVTVTGMVPDVRPYLRQASLAVVPLLTARGIQNKVLEAMAARLPVVGSPGALEGLDVNVGEHVVQADTPEQWRREILALLGDDQRRRQLGDAAHSRVAEVYSWPARMAPLVALCERLARGEDKT
jgi:glycosyltransferase involved in cell wall biosynthesis